MKSTSGVHYMALDHVRAVAALLVFCWHFIHGRDGFPVPFEGTPFWGPLVLFDEGHVGVALFMTLSGYLFSKLLEGQQVNYRGFLWNRILRLFPLLAVVMLVTMIVRAVEAGDARAAYWFLIKLPAGFVYPSWPNGGWSITAELHFYLLLPLLLFAKRTSAGWLLAILLIAVVFRALYFTITGEVQSLAYWTIVGRLDQFVAGILGFHFRRFVTHRHVVFFLVAVVFISIYFVFDSRGGFYLLQGYPSKSPIWIFLPLIEGLAFATFIAWYDTSFTTSEGVFSRAVALVGEYSYSIYLLHFFVVFAAARYIHANILDISNVYVAITVALLVFLSMIPVGYLSMTWIERPFLRFRKPYLHPPASGPVRADQSHSGR